MNYEEKYKEALKVIESLYNVVRYQSSSDALLASQTIEKAFSELRESEDERIRKSLIELVRQSSEILSKQNQESMIAWLEKQGKLANFRNKIQIGDKVTRNEDGILVNLSQLNRVAKLADKQGEQKPTDKAEPKFKDGDIIRHKKQGFTCKIIAVDDTEYRVSECCGTHLPFDSQDAYELVEQKPADKIKPKFKIEKGKWYVCTQTYTLRGKIVAIKGQTYQSQEDNTISGEDARLFIDKHDGKASDYFHPWTIQDAQNGDVIFSNDGHGNDCIELIKSVTDKKIEFWFCLINGNRYEVFDGIIPYTNLASRKDATPATKEQYNILFQKMKEAGYEWDADKKELKKIELKSAVWSEDDESHINYITTLLEDKKKEYTESGKKNIEKEIDWLKSLKDRFQLQPKKEWSDEDERAINDIIVAISMYANGEIPYTLPSQLLKDVERLRTIKPNHWKPSEQNIKDLEWCADLVKVKMGVGFYRLQVFIDDIKNL